MGLFVKKDKKEFTQNGIEWLVVGLGNPGIKYALTRHNCGWMSIDRLAERYHIEVNRVKFKSLCAETEISGKRCLVMKPTTMMNASGEAVLEAMRFYKIPIERVLVICDDISLDVGKLRIRRNGSDGGQKGLRSIINLAGSDNFHRVKIGVGAKPHPDYDLAAWVLSAFTESEMEKISDALDHAVDAVELIIASKTDEAMNKFN